ncbi:MAG: glycosyltransferase [Selenomonadaceae bacterium]|nr:glycosyltransferase [Selenomonadaceae bacterium]
MCSVSVLVPIYNVAPYLAQCLSSLAAQTMQDIEFICINDGSTDSSSEIVHVFAQRDLRFRVIDKENSGYGKSMNLGLREAKGEYIGIVESDDFVEPDMFATLYETAKGYDADIVRSDYWSYFHSTNHYFNTIGVYYYNKVISAEQVPSVFEGNPSIWSNLYRRDFLYKNDIWFTESPGASFQDIAFHLKNFMCAKRLFFLHRAFYYYRCDNVNASVKSKGKLFCVCDEYDEAERFMNERPELVKRYQLLIPFLRFGHYLWNCHDRNLKGEDRLAFLNRVYDEYQVINQKGLVVEGYWSTYRWRMIQLLLTNKELFFQQLLAKAQKNQLRRSLLNNLRSAKHEYKLAIYGAGKIGKQVLDTFLRNYVKVDCFLVTGKPEVGCLAGIPVYSVDDVTADKEDYQVLVAVSAKTQAVIYARLMELQFPNVILLDDLWQKILWG